MKQFVKRIVQLVAIIVVIYVLVFSAILAWRLFHWNTAKALAETAPEMVLEQLHDFRQEYDFQPTRETEDWIYFRVPDERSVYRLEAGHGTPEYVCSDCDGDVQIYDNQLYFLRETGNSLAGQWIVADLDGSNQQILNTYLATGIAGQTRLVIGRQLVINGGLRGYAAGVARLSLEVSGQSTTESVCIGNLQADDLLWTNGDILYFFIAAPDDEPRKAQVWRYNFVDDPELVEIPSGYRLWKHEGNQLYFEDNANSSLTQVLSLPDETWSVVNGAAYSSYFLEDGESLYINQGDIYWINQDEKRLLYSSGSKDHLELLSANDDYIICYAWIYHSNYESCGCEGANYLHHYIRTLVINRNTGDLAWESTGSNYTLDY